MKRGLDDFIRTLKTALCILLALNLQVLFVGCGQNPLAPGASQFTVQLTADHPLKQALRGSPFQDAITFVAQPDVQQFSLTFPDTKRQVRGRYAFANGEFTITEFFFKNVTRSAIVTMNANRQIDTITTSDGYQWKRDTSASLAIDVGSLSGMDAYLAANADLIDVAKSIDAESGISTSGGTTSSGTAGTTDGSGTTIVKADTSYTRLGVRTVLAVIASIWYPLVGVLQPLLTIFSVSVVLEAALVNRFDGTWNASNGGSDLQITIKSGKITRLIDLASQQEFTIVQSSLDRLEGNHVIWTVEAQILGQDPTVQFTFDVVELANGTLEGTLTALGNDFGRVPVSMARVL